MALDFAETRMEDEAMDAARFCDSRFGFPTKKPGDKWAFVYYLPRHIPRDWELSPNVAGAMSDAEAMLGQLQGMSILLRDPRVLIGPLLRKEAVSSSQIEGTQASLSDVLEAEVNTSKRSSDVLEVQRYLEATTDAFAHLEKLPISQRLLSQVHRVLLRGVRGEGKNPGELRRSPVWIGKPGATPDDADFVPPLPEHLPDLMQDWEKFVNVDGCTMPVLVQAALMHYQFETIHPFLDGNGRIGRLIINLLLHERKRLDLPMLYLSGFFEAHRNEYYQSLQRVREKGDIDGWLLFFMDAVRSQSADAIRRSKKLIDIREEYRERALVQHPRMAGLADLLLDNPYVTVKAVEDKLKISNQGARNLINKAASSEFGWLREKPVNGSGGRKLWVAPKILAAMEEPSSYDV